MPAAATNAPLRPRSQSLAGGLWRPHRIAQKRKPDTRSACHLPVRVGTVPVLVHRKAPRSPESAAPAREEKSALAQGYGLTAGKDRQPKRKESMCL